MAHKDFFFYIKQSKHILYAVCNIHVCSNQKIHIYGIVEFFQHNDFFWNMLYFLGGDLMSLQS